VSAVPLATAQPLDTRQAGGGQPFAPCEAAWKNQFVARRHHPIDVPEQLVDADPGAVFRVFQARRNRAVLPQLRKWRIIVLAGALDVEDLVAGGTTDFARQFGAKLARRAEFDLI